MINYFKPISQYSDVIKFKLELFVDLTGQKPIILRDR